MKLLLVDINLDIVNAWIDAFKGHDEVGFYFGRFQDIDENDSSPKVLVSAGNSFGIMGGGIDLAIAKYFPGVEFRVQQEIRRYHAGELNVGNAIIVGLEKFRGSKNYTKLVYTPTMRAPTIIVGTDNVYLSMRAALLEFYKHYYPIEDDYTLVIPGLGGLCGSVHPKSVAAQMALAYKNFLERPRIYNHRDMIDMNIKVWDTVLRK